MVVITHEMQVINKLCNKVTVLEEGIIRESGTVSEVFTNPKTKAAKRLIYVGLSEDVDIDEEGNDADESFMDGI